MSPRSWILLAIAIGVSLLIIRQLRVSFLRAQLRILKNTLEKALSHYFLVQPCSRCHESEMRFIECSPRAKSVHYECLHCGKKNHSPAGSPEAADFPQKWENYQTLIKYIGADPEAMAIEFETAEAVLPYEQSTRTPIPEAQRSEVWRRDQGRCVTCNSKENLQFDHIIPVSKGGATSVKNLQILCGPCNQRKGNAI